MGTVIYLNNLPKLQKALDFIRDDIDMDITQYSSANDLAASINNGSSDTSDPSLFIIAGSNPDADSDAGKKMRLLARLRGHRKFKNVPVVCLYYQGDDKIRYACDDNDARFIELPARKKEVLSVIRGLLNGSLREQAPDNIRVDEDRDSDELISEELPSALSAGTDDKTLSWETGNAPLVGREVDLNVLRGLVKKLCGGEGGIAALKGETGIGKTRIITELKNTEEMTGVTLLEGRTAAENSFTGFYPVIDILHNWLKVDDNISEKECFEKLQDNVRSLCPDDAEEIIPFIALLLGIKLSGPFLDRVAGISGEALRRLIYISVKKLIKHIASDAPLVLCIDDLHRADNSTLTLLKNIFHLCRNNPLLVLIAIESDFTRPAELDDFLADIDPLLYTEIILQPLSEGDVSQLVYSLSKDIIPDDLYKKIIFGTRGNPFFIEEKIRLLRDSENYNGSAENTLLPHTATEVINERIELLDDDAAKILSVASVFGMEFTKPLASLAAATVNDIGKSIDVLIDRNFINGPLDADRQTYFFNEPLIQEAAYDSIIIPKKKELHLHAAQSLENVYTERFHRYYGLMAWHYWMGENTDKTILYLEKAGEEAQKISAMDEMRCCYNRALDMFSGPVTGDDQKHRMAFYLENIALSCYYAGEFENSLDYFDSALKITGVSLPEQRVLKFFTAAYHALIISLQLSLGINSNKHPGHSNIVRMRNLFPRQFTVGIEDKRKTMLKSLVFLRKYLVINPAELEFAVEALAGIIIVFVRFNQFRKISEKLITHIARKVPLENVKDRIYFKLAEINYAYMAGHWDADYNDGLITDALTAGEVNASAAYLFNYGLISIESGECPAVSSVVRRIHVLADEYNDRAIAALGYELDLFLKLKSGEYTRGLQVYDETVDSFYGLLDRGKEILLTSIVLRMQIENGELNFAEVTMKKLTDLISDQNDILPFYQVNAFSGLFFYHVEQLRSALKTTKKNRIKLYKIETRKYKKMMLKAVKEIIPGRIEAYRLIAVYYELLGKRTKARAWFDKSIKEGEGSGAKLELSRTYYQVGKFLYDQVYSEPESIWKRIFNIKKENFRREKFSTLHLFGLTAEDHLERARSMFEDMDLRHDLEHLNNFMLEKNE